MAYKKNLGMGLDILLADQTRGRETDGINQVKEMFDRAVKEDAGENLLEAYYWYRRVIDCSEACPAQHEFNHLLSHSYNNAAVIANEYGYQDQAGTYLERALQVEPDNATARENLKLIKP